MAMQRATAVTSAPPDAEAARVKKMMASRPTLNPNQRRAPRQDLSGAVNGVLTGRGGNQQQLGTAAMKRLAAQPFPEMQAYQAQPAFADKVGQGAQRSDFMASNPGASADALMAQKGAPSGMAANLAGALAGQGGGGAPPAGAAADVMSAGVGGAQVPPGAAPPGMMAGVGGALAGAGGPGGGMPSGIPPAIMQRLSALRGAQPQGAPGGAPQMRGSFADFWARNGGGQGMAAPY